jgi:tetratricopeptide (TPR) repeat protein
MRKQLLGLLFITLWSSLSAAEPELQKTQATVLYEEGLAFAREGDFHASMDKLERALLLDPTNKEIRNLLESFRIDPPPDSKPTPERLSKEYYKQGLDAFIEGNHKKAKNLFRQAVKANPGNKEAQRGLDRLAEQEKKQKLAEPGAQPGAGTGRKLTP